MKLNKHTVATRYAKAYYNLAEEHDCIKEAFDNMMDIRQIFGEYPGLGLVLSDARLTLAQKRPIVDNLIKNFPELMQNFVLMIFDYDRMGDMELIVDEFEKLYDHKNRTILAKVTTAVPLTEAQKTRLADVFVKKLDGKKVIFDEVVDPEILGGVIIEAEHQIFDGSIRLNLETLKKQIAK
ncbi:ATP synthase F1 subunit delta [Carnobacterium divergens]|uniref:ATP synthase F1 subunit delta n=1 Tax=Carnobacterium divergens TaxID=2748 RepID=UPI0039B0AD40